MTAPTMPVPPQLTTSSPTYIPAPPPPATYSPIPRGLLSDMRDTPLAVGIYALIAWLAFCARAPIPLSPADLIRYDPRLSRGSVMRALRRLVGGGWLVEIRSGKKIAYVPTWGKINGKVTPWRWDAKSNGRPRHVDVYKVDRRLLTTCMGCLETHDRHPALVKRWVKAPLLGLADIGVYALALAEVGEHAATPALRRMGLLLDDGALQPLPADDVILALASQQALEQDAPEVLTRQGAARLGVRPPPPASPSPAAQPLFFIPPNQFGHVIGDMIDHMITITQLDHSLPGASERAASDTDTAAVGSHESKQNLIQTEEAAPLPPTPPGGGLSVRRQKKRSGSAERATRRQERIPENETTRLLREIGVRSSKVIADLASMPPDTVAAAAAAAKSRRTTRDLGGVVARMLCDLRDHGTPIPEPERSASACPTAAEIRASFERLGITLSDPEPPGETFGAWMDAGADVAGGRACMLYRAAEPADFATQVREELRWRVHPRYRPTVDRIDAAEVADGVLITCAHADVLRVVQNELLAVLRGALADLGVPGALHLDVAQQAQAGCRGTPF